MQSRRPKERESGTGEGKKGIKQTNEGNPSEDTAQGCRGVGFLSDTSTARRQKFLY